MLFNLGFTDHDVCCFPPCARLLPQVSQSGPVDIGLAAVAALVNWTRRISEFFARRSAAALSPCRCCPCLHSYLLDCETNNETYLSTIRRSSQAYPRFSSSHGYPRWPRCAERTPRQGPQAPGRLTRPRHCFTLACPAHLCRFNDPVLTHGLNASLKRMSFHPLFVCAPYSGLPTSCYMLDLTT
jgi:hypothetical protein